MQFKTSFKWSVEFKTIEQMFSFAFQTTKANNYGSGDANIAKPFDWVV